MRTINDALDAVKARHQLTSDYKLAMFLGIGSSNIGNYRHGRSLPDERMCARIAEALGEDPALLIVEMQAQRAASTETAKLWERIADKLKAVSLLLLVFLGGISGGPPPATAGEVTGVDITYIAPNTHCIKWLAQLRSRFLAMVGHVVNCVTGRAAQPA